MDGKGGKTWMVCSFQSPLSTKTRNLRTPPESNLTLHDRGQSKLVPQIDMTAFQCHCVSLVHSFVTHAHMYACMYVRGILKKSPFAPLC